MQAFVSALRFWHVEMLIVVGLNGWGRAKESVVALLAECMHMVQLGMEPHVWLLLLTRTVVVWYIYTRPQSSR